MVPKRICSYLNVFRYWRELAARVLLWDSFILRLYLTNIKSRGKGKKSWIFQCSSGVITPDLAWLCHPSSTLPCPGNIWLCLQTCLFSPLTEQQRVHNRHRLGSAGILPNTLRCAGQPINKRCAGQPINKQCAGQPINKRCAGQPINKQCSSLQRQLHYTEKQEHWE
jgi:hypothetical protein